MAPAGQQSDRTTCPLCGRDDFTSYRGMRIHMSQGHNGNPWEDEDTLREEYVEKGRSSVSLSREWGCDKKTVLKYLGFFDIETRPENSEIDRGWRDEEYMRELYAEQQMSVEDIAEILDTHNPVIVRWLRRHGIETREQLPPSGPDHPRWVGGTRSYRGENWGKQRRKAIKRDQHRCQRCGDRRPELDREPHIHHIKPYRLFDDSETANELSNLVALCSACHQKVERMYPEIPDEIQ